MNSESLLGIHPRRGKIVIKKKLDIDFKISYSITKYSQHYEQK